jgi:MFS family permease
MWSFFFAATGGPVLAGLLLALNLNNFQIGLVNSMMALFLPFQIVGAVIQQRYFNRKRFWFSMIFSYYSSFVLILLLILIWPGISHAAAVFMLVTMFAVGQMAAQLGTSVWFAWMGDLIPQHESNNFWNRRSGFSQISMVIGALSTGLLIDALGRGQRLTYVLMYAFGAIFGFISLFTQAKVPDPDLTARTNRQSVWLKFRLTWRNQRFRQLLYFFGSHSLAVWIIAPFMFIYLQNTLNLSMTTIQLLTALSCAVGFFSTYAFRVIGKKYGRKPIAIVCAFTKGIEFICWGILAPGSGWIMALPAFILGGFVNIGLATCTFSLITSVEKKKNQSFSIAVFFAVIGLVSFISSFFSGIVYDWIGSLSFLQNHSLSPFNVLALIVAVAFFLSVLLFLNFKEDGAVSAVNVVKNLLSLNPFRAVYHAYMLSCPLEEKSRVETLSKAEGNLIASDLMSDLYNPSSQVRESAVWNIARKGAGADPQLESELIKIMDMPELGLQAAAAKALGQMRSTKASPSLAKYMRGRDISLAQGCIASLGMIGDKTAINEFDALLAIDRFRPIWPAAAEALSKLSGFQHTRKIYRAYAVESNWVLKKQLLIALGNTLTAKKKKAFSIFEEEEKQPGSAIDELLKFIHGELESTNLSDDEKKLLGHSFEDFDFDRFAASLEKILAVLLNSLKILPDEQRFLNVHIDVRLSTFFNPGGQVKHPALLKNEYTSVAVWLLVNLWTELKYSGGNLNRFVFLTALHAVRSLLENNKHKKHEYF